MRRIELPQIELQIAPLIDVCFLLLFFYILTSKPVPPEGTLPSTLPGTAVQDEPLEIPDQQLLTVLSSGQILVNEQPFDSPTSSDLPQLRNFLSRLKETAAAHKGRALVSLEVADSLPHQRFLEVLHACTQAGIDSVAFLTTAEEAP